MLAAGLLLVSRAPGCGVEDFACVLGAFGAGVFRGGGAAACLAGAGGALGAPMSMENRSLELFEREAFVVSEVDDAELEGRISSATGHRSIRPRARGALVGL